jgi:hypothetical protein
MLTWEARDLSAPFAVHPDGRHILMGSQNMTGMGKDTLELLTLSPNGKLDKQSWQPFYFPGQAKNAYSIDKEPMVTWAAFVGPRHIVTLCGDGRLQVWDLEPIKRVAVIAGVQGIPAVTHDGNLVAFLSGENAALLDPAEARVLNVRRFGRPPEKPVLAFDPEGERLACGGQGRIAVWNVETGRVQTAFTAELEIAPLFQMLPAFGWAGNEHFYNHGDLYDFRAPIPVWHYERPEWAMPFGRELWAIVWSSEKNSFVLRAFTLPQPGLQARINAALRKPNLFTLRPGDPVRIDVSGLAADRQDEVRGVLEQRAEEQGYRPSAEGWVTFQASEDKNGVPVSIRYDRRNLLGIVGESKTFTYTKRLAHFRIVTRGRVLQEESDFVAPPGSLKYTEGMSTHLTECGGPNYALYAKCKIPGVIRGDRLSGALGISDLTGAGISDRR